jgi:hypothetical protein
LVLKKGNDQTMGNVVPMREYLPKLNKISKHWQTLIAVAATVLFNE